MEKLHQIVREITTDKRILELISKMKPEDLQADLASHCKEELYRVATEYPGKIEALDAEGKLYPYFVGLIRNQHWSSSSTFYRRLRKKGILPRKFVAQETSRIKKEELTADKMPAQLTPIQQKALELIYKRIETVKTKVEPPEGKEKGNAFRIFKLEKKLAEIKDIRVLMEAFRQYQSHCMTFILKFYRSQARFVNENKDKDFATVMQSLEAELQKATDEKEILTRNLSVHQKLIADRLEAKAILTKKETIAKRKEKKKRK